MPDFSTSTDTNRLGRAFEALPDPFFVLDSDWRVTFLNGAAAAFVDRSEAALQGRVLWEVFPGVIGSSFEVSLRLARSEAKLVEDEAYFSRFGRWVEVRAFPVDDGLAVHVRDVTARKDAQRRAQALREVTLALARPLTRDEVVRAVLTLALPALGAYAGLIARLTPEGDALEVEQTAGYPVEIARTWRRHPLEAPLPVTTCVRENRVVLLPEAELDGDPTLRRHRTPTTRSLAALPLRFGDKVTGALLVAFDVAHAFDAAQRAFLEDVAAQGAAALERAHAFDTEVRAARHARALVELGARLIEAQRFEDVTDAALLVGRRASGAYAAALYRLEDGRLVEIERQDDEHDSRAWRTVDLSSPFLAALDVTSAPHFLMAEAVARLAPDVRLGETTRAIALLPLRVRDRPLGLLLFAFDHTPTFDDLKRGFLTAVASQTALALERVALAHRSQEERDRYRVLLTVTNDAVWDWQLHEDLVTWNEGISNLFGYALHAKETTGEWWKDHIHPHDRSRVLSGIDAALEGSVDEWRDEYRFRRADGSYALVLDRGQVLRGVDGRAVRMIGGMTDLSERERHRVELQEVNASLERRIAERTEALQAETAALSAFAAFTRAVGNETNLHALARLALETLMSAFGEGGAVYYDRERDEWKAAVWAGESIDETGLLPNSSPRAAMFADARAREDGLGGGTLQFGAAALYPVRQEDDVCGLLAVSLKATRTWTPRDRAIFEAVGHGLSLAAERAAHVRRVDEEREATAAFAAFTEAVGVETDGPTLVERAMRVVRASLSHVSVAYYELDDTEWKARLLSEDVTPDLAEELRQGVPRVAPNPASREAEPQFVDGWNATGDRAPRATEYGAAAFLPLRVRGETRRLFALATREARAWTERERSLARAVARGLTLAFERAAVAHALEAANTALESFGELAHDLAFETDSLAIVKRAQEIVLSLLPRGVCLYYEPHGGFWHNRVQTGPLGPALQKVVDASLRFEDATNLTAPWRTLPPYFQDEYDRSTDNLREVTGQIGATATVPLVVHGVPRGVFAVALFGARAWSAGDRVVLETATRHLKLALERAETARELERQRAALKASNEDLESFSYSVSHDLRAPLRHVSGFSSMLRRALERGDEAQMRRALAVIEQAVERANVLIDALLQFSRLSRQSVRRDPVDLGALVRDVRAEAEQEAAGREVEWVVHELPTVPGDAALLRQVLANLLTNAVKYSAKAPRLRVEVGADERPGEVVVFVRDQGAGFDARYVGKLFGVFQRLHSDAEFAGIGIGLATVRRIVERYGGRVWAESTLGEGATFFFAWPLNS
ncbi:GAF domain-containing protein [Deinococcus yavapaiensis]|uniref:histidine kinase n=1 Tax=Deinococcus yavapaiensis KR-236 TaxID=694435 RepID=A0A318S4H5_9DEIO|nr:GAF domain-containing protein [Deinococcus yavapaiensis]PYE53483.1 PAS domain S-box-containing protein [Deinococcus yavapaiensis KR-236]